MSRCLCAGKMLRRAIVNGRRSRSTAARRQARSARHYGHAACHHACRTNLLVRRRNCRYVTSAELTGMNSRERSTDVPVIHMRDVREPRTRM